MKVWLANHKKGILWGYVLAMLTLTTFLQIMESTGRLP